MLFCGFSIYFLQHFKLFIWERLFCPEIWVEVDKIGKTNVSPYCWKLLQSLLQKFPGIIDDLTADTTRILTC